jgi:hypothetical protein
MENRHAPFRPATSSAISLSALTSLKTAQQAGGCAGGGVKEGMPTATEWAVGRRLPKHRPPTRSGEMLEEDFPKPLVAAAKSISA